MQPSIEDLRDRYLRLSDEELVHFANKEGFQLRPEAQQVLLEEIQTRQLGDLVMGSSIPIDSENTITDAMYEDTVAMMEMVSALPCPKCSSNSEPLNAAKCKKNNWFHPFFNNNKSSKDRLPRLLTERSG